MCNLHHPLYSHTNTDFDCGFDMLWVHKVELIALCTLMAVTCYKEGSALLAWQQLEYIY